MTVVLGLVKYVYPDAGVTLSHRGERDLRSSVVDHFGLGFGLGSPSW